jgi:cyclohexadienyl dehydratase
MRWQRLALCLWSVACAIAPATPASSVEDGSELLNADGRVRQVLQLVDQRLSLMPGVAAWKWQHHSPVRDPEREQAVVSRAVALAAPLGLADSGVRRLFEQQIALADEVESDLVGTWDRNGYGFSGPVPSLADEVRPRLDQLTVQLLRALYLAAPELRRPDFQGRYAEPAGQLLASMGWNARSRADLLAALAAVRTVPGPALERIKASGLLRVGTTGDYAPFSTESQGRVSGIDIELGRALASQLHVEAAFIRTAWATLNADLSDGQFDIAVGGVSATPARAAVAELSPPYLSGGKTFIARCRDGGGFVDLKAVDRRGVRVIVNAGGTNEQYARANLRSAQLRVYPDNRSIFDEIRAGHADVMITDDVEVQLQTRLHPDLCRPFAGTLTHADKVFMIERDPALVAAVDAWLKAELARGTPSRLLDEELTRTAP